MKIHRLTCILILLAVCINAGAADRKHIVMKRIIASDAPFSEAVLADDTLYVGGHLGIDPKTGKPGATPEEEARLVMESMKRTIESAAMSMDDLVSVQVFCSDLEHFAAFNTVYRTYFHGSFPARAFIGSGKLLFNARFEVMGVAVKQKK
ncbi:MAG TPA: Rid family hydrolase [Candidatus Saccharimonadales bacterium]|jgi:2-iminobutanoate/2-iminopropanoate deaminase|nr:Rid family hydrolase [Candidatus Saccharimonadales bacterium]